MNTHSERISRPSLVGLASEYKIKFFPPFGSENSRRFSAGFFKSFRHLLVILMVFLFILTACSSIQGRGDSIHPGGKLAKRQIRISNAVIGSSIRLSPPILHLAPGEGVVWINQTSYDIRINFDADSARLEGPSVIPRHASVRGKFNEAGTYTYTLLFSSSKTFGKIIGEIVVGEPELQPHSPPKLPDNGPSLESPPLRMPEII